MLEGYRPYDPESARLYNEKRWWLGLTMGDIFDKTTDLYPGKEGLVSGEERYTYGELRRMVDTVAFRLLEVGFRRGDMVLLQLPNSSEFIIAYFAFQKIGVITVLLTVNHTPREIAHLANLTQPRGWICPDHYRKTDFVAMSRQVRKENPVLEKVIVVGQDIPEGGIKFDDLRRTSSSAEEIRKALEAARPSPSDVCQILPSGGTTGLPKGAPRSHNDYLCNIEYKSKAWDLNVTDTCLVASTVGHNLALLVTVSGSIFHGARIVMLDSTYPEDFCRVVQQEKVTCTGLVPTLISRIVAFDRLDDYDLSSLKRIYVGAANSPADLVKNAEEKLGVRYINAFGMVEGPLAQSRPYDPPEVTLNTIGRPCNPYEDMVTLDQEGRKTSPGVEGELAAKGPGIFTGYFKNPQANQTAFTPDGYFRTGDLAVIDEPGYIRITGRIKDIIIRGGENIAARDVEELISSHPAVEYVAVVGMPDKDLGEAVCAYIKPVKDQAVSGAEILDHLKKLEAAKILIPARIEFTQDIPLTAADKADKKMLKKDIEAKIEAAK